MTTASSMKSIYKAQALRLGLIASLSNILVIKSCVSAAAGVMECKNDSYAVNQTIAEMVEMVEMMGNASLLVFAEEQHTHEIMIAGLAVNYATSKSIYIKLTVNFTSESSQIEVSKDSVPFYKGLNAILQAIQFF